MATFYIDPDNGSPFNSGSSPASPVASWIFATATVTGYIGTSSDGGNTISAPSNILTVVSVSSGSVSKGRRITGTGVAANTSITSDGSTLGAAGSYTVNSSQSVTLTTFTIDNVNIYGGAGNTYLQKRGTTFDVSNVSTGVSLSSSCNIDAYGTGASPIIRSVSGTAINPVNRTAWAVSNLTFISTASKCADMYNHGQSSWTDCSFTGTTSAVTHNVINNDANLTFTRCTFKGTANSSVASAFFGQVTVSGKVFKGLTFDTCYFNDCAYNGIQIKSGDSGSTSAYYDGISIKNSQFLRNGGYGSLILSGDPIGTDKSRWTRNVSVTGSEFGANLGPGASLWSIGGYFANNKVHDNNFGTVTGTGGCQFTGSNWLVELNAVWHNGNGNYPADGAGIYLDQVVGSSAYGCNLSVVRKNIVWNHTGYANGSNINGNVSSPGIKLYHSDTNEIYGNICYSNRIGIAVDNWSPSNKIYNNTIINNIEVGIAVGWNVGATELIINNLIIGSPIDLVAQNYGDRATTGSLTLSGTGGPKQEAGTSGVITATSSSTDFSQYDIGYAIREVGGNGYGYIYKPKTTNSIVSLAVLVPFSKTSFLNGEWALTYGTSQVGVNDYNCAFNSSRANGGVGVHEVLVNLNQGANDILAVDPLIDPLRNVNSATLKNSGKYIANSSDFYGKEFQSPPTIGAVQSQGARKIQFRLSAASRNISKISL